MVDSSLSKRRVELMPYADAKNGDEAQLRCHEGFRQLTDAAQGGNQPSRDRRAQHVPDPRHDLADDQAEHDERGRQPRNAARCNRHASPNGPASSAGASAGPRRWGSKPARGRDAGVSTIASAAMTTSKAISGSETPNGRRRTAGFVGRSQSGTANSARLAPVLP